jgi:uncharacterized protein (DUF488 family)
MLTEIVTIGVYGWEAERFFAALRDAGVDVFCDVRQRRGVRGREYAFANSERLQACLAEHGIRYIHCRDLAPAAELRMAQYAADAAARTAKRQRTILSAEFVQAYSEQLFRGFDSHNFVESLDPDARIVALFCVEREPAACHRSLLASRLSHDLGLSIRHLLPA